MGIDIHTYLINSEGTVLKSDFFDGRNSDWFDSINGNHYGPIEYDYLPIIRNRSHMPPLPEEIIKDIDENYCYGLCAIKISDYLKWYDDKKPYLKAGWITSYDKFLYDKKRITPTDYYTTLPENDININDYYFMTWTEDTCDEIIIDTIESTIKRPDYENTYFVYYFDR